MARFDAEGNEIGFMAASKFQAAHPKEFAAAQKQYGRGGLTIREFAREAGATKREDITAKRLGLTPDELRSKAADGTLSWWESPEGFKSLGFAKTLTLNHVSYYGGWPGHQAPEGKSNLLLKIDVTGITLRKFAAIFTIPWSDVTDIAVEGPEAAQNRFTATRLIALGPLGLAFKKDRKGSREAIITVITTAGDEAIFHVGQTLPRDIAPKLAPLAIQARRATKQDGQTDQDGERMSSAGALPDVAAQIEKLADLKAKGILTDEEFASKKAELLARM